MRTKHDVIIQLGDRKAQLVEIEAETVGRNRTVIVHREIEKVLNEDGTVGFTATGDTWVVTFKQSGHSIVRGIENRLQARTIAKRIVPFIDAFRAVVIEEAARVVGLAAGPGTVRGDDTADAVRALAEAEGVYQVPTAGTF